MQRAYPDEIALVAPCQQGVLRDCLQVRIDVDGVATVIDQAALPQPEPAGNLNIHSLEGVLSARVHGESIVDGESSAGTDPGVAWQVTGFTVVRTVIGGAEVDVAAQHAADNQSYGIKMADREGHRQFANDREMAVFRYGPEIGQQEDEQHGIGGQHRHPGGRREQHRRRQYGRDHDELDSAVAWCH